MHVVHELVEQHRTLAVDRHAPVKVTFGGGGPLRPLKLTDLFRFFDLKLALPPQRQQSLVKFILLIRIIFLVRLELPELAVEGDVHDATIEDVAYEFLKDLCFDEFFRKRLVARKYVRQVRLLFEKGVEARHDPLFPSLSHVEIEMIFVGLEEAQELVKQVKEEVSDSLAEELVGCLPSLIVGVVCRAREGVIKGRVSIPHLLIMPK